MLHSGVCPGSKWAISWLYDGICLSLTVECSRVKYVLAPRWGVSYYSGFTLTFVVASWPSCLPFSLQEEA